MHHFFLVTLLLSLFAADCAFADGWESLRTRVFTRLGREQGMPHPNVAALLQDSEGFIWVGTTQGGLARFDGQRFKAFVHHEEDPASLPGDFVLALSVDGKGVSGSAPPAAMSPITIKPPRNSAPFPSPPACQRAVAG